MNFVNVKEDIIERLEQRIGNQYYLSDLAFEITESENATGSWYCSTYKAKQDIKENFDEFGQIFEYMRNSFEYNENPFIEPEKFHCAAMITLYEQTFMYAAADEEDVEIEIDVDFISRIKSKLEEVAFEDVFGI